MRTSPQLFSRESDQAGFDFWLNAMTTNNLDIYWLVMPPAGDKQWWNFLPYDLGALVGLLALFMMAYQWVMKGKSMIPKGDPRLNESFAFENY